jgi:DNA-binding HxlR family transcriptional regulator
MKTKSKAYNCPVEAALDVMGGKWKPLILWWLSKRGTQRFGELRKLMPDITEKMLTHQLREMERDGIVERKIYAVVPPKVEYWLTDYGRSLKRSLNALSAWGEQHMERTGAHLKPLTAHPPSSA